MTEKGIQKARQELERLQRVERPEVLGYLEDAKDGGDSADNTEYLYLTQELASVDRRIRELEFKLKNAQRIERVESAETVTLGSNVVIQESGSLTEYHTPETYTIVGSSEADPEQGSISNESPLGRALLDHRVGEEVAVDSPDGRLLFRIVGIT